MAPQNFLQHPAGLSWLPKVVEGYGMNEAHPGVFGDQRRGPGQRRQARRAR